MVHLDINPANILERNVHCDDIYHTFGHIVYICNDEIGGQWVEPWKGCNFFNTNTTKLMFGGSSKGEMCV